jgi:hypothetical protein
MMNTEKNMTQTLAQYLADRNAATLAWVAEDPDNRWAGTYTEDLAHWAEIGVLTVRDFIRTEMQTQYSDLHKDACGFRPHGVNTSDWTYEQLEVETERLYRYMESQAEYDAEWERQEEAYRLEQEAEHAAWLAEQPEAIDYVACHYQEGWL